MMGGVSVPASSVIMSTLPPKMDSDGDHIPDDMKPLLPWLLGQDQALIFIDIDQNVGTGYRARADNNQFAVGAEYLLEITGKHGQILKSKYLKYTGNGHDWDWNSLGTLKVGKDSSRLETQIGLEQVGLNEGQGYNLYFYIADWNRDWLDESKLLSFNNEMRSPKDNDNSNSASRHYIDASGGAYGIIARQLSITPTIDGIIGLGEWTDANYDAISGTYFYTISVKYDSTDLYVLLDSWAPPSDTDYCEIAFDINHSGGNLESTDYKFNISNPNSPSYTAYNGGSGTWVVDGTLTWTGGATYGVYEFRIPLAYVWDNGTASTRGEMAGFQVHYEHQQAGTDGYQYWVREEGLGDASTWIDDPDNFGDLIYNNTPLLINEVAVNDKFSFEWVEFY
ncbi:MAG: hypothetical protein KAJ51_01775, partial [Thermoplasmata archaeon]|nr:hypothetical protein [Thermoplasmata archaeon]